MGVPVDEDGCGMTAFVVFSQLGFYPVTPGLPIYNIGSPVFENATVHLENGNDLPRYSYFLAKLFIILVKPLVSLHSASM